MENIEPPEVPQLLEEPIKKESFFQKLFSKRKTTESKSVDIPELPDLPDMNVPVATVLPKALPDISPELQMPTELPEKTVGKAKGKQLVKKFSKYDNSNNFDWSQSISNQEPIILDSMRNTQEIKSSIEESAGVVEEHKDLAENNYTQAMPAEDTTIAQNSEINTMINQDNVLEKESKVPSMPTINKEEEKEFQKIETEHQKLRSRLKNTLSNPSFKQNKKVFLDMLKKYDERIEERIESKQIELSIRRQKMDRLHKVLMDKERELKDLQSYLKKLDQTLNQKEFRINDIIAKEVQAQVTKNTLKEKQILKKGILRVTKTSSMLQKKLSAIDKDMNAFNIKKEKILKEEHDKLTAGQEIYEKKLKDLEQERRAFEARRSQSMDLVGKGETIGRELRQLNKIKKFVEKGSQEMKKELSEDKELKDAILEAEKRLTDERRNLDNMIFSKFIEERLQNIQPTNLEETKIVTYEHSKIYSLITQCRDRLIKKDINGAKVFYNHIKSEYEHTGATGIEKSMLFNAIRALYNEIQITIIESNINR